MAHLHLNAGATGRLGTNKTGVAARLVSNILTWNDIRRTRKALSKLSARELDDIGLSPWDLR